MKVSVMQPQWPYEGRVPAEAECVMCHRPAECRHHVYAGGLRKVSEANGLWVYMCHECHNLHPRKSVHQNPELWDELKAECQRAYESYHGHEAFIALVGRSYV